MTPDPIERRAPALPVEIDLISCSRIEEVMSCSSRRLRPVELLREAYPIVGDAHQ